MSLKAALYTPIVNNQMLKHWFDSYIYKMKMNILTCDTVTPKTIGLELGYLSNHCFETNEINIKRFEKYLNETISKTKKPELKGVQYAKSVFDKKNIHVYCNGKEIGCIDIDLFMHEGKKTKAYSFFVTPFTEEGPEIQAKTFWSLKDIKQAVEEYIKS